MPAQWRLVHKFWNFALQEARQLPSAHSIRIPTAAELNFFAKGFEFCV